MEICYAQCFFTDPQMTCSPEPALGDSSRGAGVLVPKESDARKCVVASCRLGSHGAFQSFMEEKGLPLASLSIRCGPVCRWSLTVQYCGRTGYCKGRLHAAGLAEQGNIRQRRGHRSREKHGPGKQGGDWKLPPSNDGERSVVRTPSDLMGCRQVFG